MGNRDKAKNKKSSVERLERPPGAVLLHHQDVKKPWFDASLSAPEHMTVRHDAFSPYLSRELQPGEKLKVYVQPPGKEVAGGVDHTPIAVTYELLPGQPGSAPVGRLDLKDVRNYMVLTKSYKAEVLDNDAVEIWPSHQKDYYIMGLVKEKCHVCNKETGDEANGVAYICDACNRGVHAACAGVEKPLGEDEGFTCPACRPAGQAPAKPGPAAEAGGAASEDYDSDGAENGEGEEEEEEGKEEEEEGEEEEEEEDEEEEEEEDSDYEAKGKGKGKAAGKAKGGKQAKKAEVSERKAKRQKK